MQINLIKSFESDFNEILKFVPLEEAKEILIEFEDALEKKKRIWLQVRKGDLNSKEASEGWKEKSSRCWLHGATNIFEANKLEEWIFTKPELTKIAQKKANIFIKLWRKIIKEKSPYGYYYADDPKFNLKSKKDETLMSFIIRMAIKTEKKGKRHKIKWRALKSFLKILREKYSKEEIAFIEQIFPKNMDIRCRKIIRKILLKVYPISIEMTGDIIKTLSIMCKESRRNAQHGLAETLGLCWLCLTASRLRLPTELQMIYKIKTSALNLEGEFPTILIPTFFGPQKIQISRRIAKFLFLLSKIPSKKTRDTILQKPFRSLSRIFGRVLERLRPDATVGNITFMTLISPPHIFGENHRF